MFEDFSFLSSANNTDSELASFFISSQFQSGYTSESVSPRTSRIGTPSASAPSRKALHRDARFYPADVGALTTRFQDHTLDHNASSRSSSASTSTATSATSSPSVPSSPTVGAAPQYTAEPDMALWSSTLSELHSLTPPASSSLSYSSMPSSVIRRQRQSLVRLQCLAQTAPELAILMEECHPSSLSIPTGIGGGGSRRTSVTSAGVLEARVEKTSKGRGAGKVGKRGKKRTTL